MNRTASEPRRRDRYDPTSDSRRKLHGSRRGQEQDDVDNDDNDSYDDETDSVDDESNSDKKDDHTSDRKRDKSRPKIHGVRVTVDTSGDEERDVVMKKKHKGKGCIMQCGGE